MENITLEQVDKVRERCNVSYAEAKEALVNANGDVLEAIIHIEKNKKKENDTFYNNSDSNSDCSFNSMSIDEIKNMIKNIIEKGNVTRIKIKKNDEQILDIPVKEFLINSMFSLE